MSYPPCRLTQVFCQDGAWCVLDRRRSVAVSAGPVHRVSNAGGERAESGVDGPGADLSGSPRVGESAWVPVPVSVSCTCCIK
jgi:hypothetical protein